MTEAVGSIGGCDRIEHGLHGLPKSGLGAASQGAEQLLDLAEDHLDRIQIGAIGRQVLQFCLPRFDQFSNACPLVARQIIHDHDVARLELGNEYLLHKRLEDIAVDRSIDHGRTLHAFDTQGGDQRGRLPVSVRRLIDQAFTTWGSPSKPGHVRLGPRFIDEDQSSGVRVLRPRAPLSPSSDDIRAVLLRRMDRFFLNESPIFFKAWQSVESAH